MYFCKDCGRCFINPDYESCGEDLPCCPFCGSSEIIAPSEYGRAKLFKEFYDQSEVVFNIKIKMKVRWVDHFMSMLACMEHYGNLGCSREVGIYSDGDGDFRPKFETDVKWEHKDPVRDEHGNRIYDAG